MFGIKTRIKKRIKKAAVNYRNRHADQYPKRCACCGNRCENYLPLSSYYSEQHKKYNVTGRSKPEMLNSSEYSCPVCKANDRDRAYALYIKKEMDPEEKIAILDIAPNRGLSAFVRTFFPNADYKTGDLFKENVDYKLDIMDMHQIADSSIDFFICSHVLEHVKDDITAMKELRRILKKGRAGICVVPIDLSRTEIDEDPDCSDEGERWRRFGQGDHVRAYSKQGYIDRLRSVGFDVLEYDRSRFTEQEMFENGLSESSTVYIVS